jgi:hypothetical protein
MDPAYIFAASVIVVSLGLLALVIWRLSRPKLATPLSPDGNWWWDGKKWRPQVSSDGLWKWDGYRWNANKSAARPETASESVARALIDPNPGARFARETIISLVVAMVVIGLSVALNPLSHRAIDHAVIGTVAFVATRFLLNRLKV